MANDSTFYPHIIDTAGAGLVVTGSVNIRKVRWVGATTAGHTAVITDANDRVIWASVAPAANYVESDTVNHNAEGGYKVPTLGSGKLYIDVD
jgi:sugar (pentulose or hexulose) kinase